MNNIGKLTTFHQLLIDENTIIIPKVQRDYAYGRQEDKVAEVLNDILEGILQAVKSKNTNILDFIYGGSYVRKNKIIGGLIPLDGQQRLTTLFLLHFYASLLRDEQGNIVSQEEVDILTKFRYETRQSATEFCLHLVKEIRKNLLKSYKPGINNIKELIEDDALYLSTYNSDPTILSMLNVLHKIESKCAEIDVNNLTPCLWKRLIDGDYIKFYTLSLEDFGLTDDLFIKMNARGKKLTQFEIFKSNMMADIDMVDKDLKDVFSKKMDTEWIDIVWDYTNKTLDNKRVSLDITQEADKKYSTLFNNIFRLEFYRRNLPSLDQKEPTIRNIFSDKGGIEDVIDIFNTLYKIHKNEGFDKLWFKYFYFSDSIVGRDDSIRLFWSRKRNSVFELAMLGDLTVPEIIYFYALYLLYKREASEKVSKKCLRIIHNLMTSNVRVVDARTDKLPSFLTEVKYIIDHEGIDVYYDKDEAITIDGKIHKLAFTQNAWNEEYKKQRYLDTMDYELLIKYENHNILQCSLSLFMDFCLDETTVEDYKVTEPLDAAKLLRLLVKFETVFSDEYSEYFERIRIAQLDSEIEYMQYDPYMQKDGGSSVRRYFLTTQWNLSNFYIRYGQRRNQESILQILDKMPVPAELKSPEKKCMEFSIRDWKYYLAKYPSESNRDYTRYGMGVWDNRDENPLDLIILNSSQHSENNLEWMMMTNILWNRLGNSQIYQLDDHGCSPILITSCGAAISFKNGVWFIESLVDIVSTITYKHPELIVKAQEERNVTIDLPKNENTMDYIDLGILLVRLIENKD
ncbi:Protein of unknown function DUF262 [Bacteroides luti]|uniref:GmrSD restriction endonucleases N-terminal domain-containing protein n=1 Tax=Bacteroides luti TaxID=1297750 RepID=A0A1M5GLU5_9BACE|nr:DUF262 domain-containing protein [Bacteroides luti]SHG04653.1 Protein of unknown function DUF262 [Bacteroides luti]